MGESSQGHLDARTDSEAKVMTETLVNGFMTPAPSEGVQAGG